MRIVVRFEVNGFGPVAPCAFPQCIWTQALSKGWSDLEHRVSWDSWGHIVTSDLPHIHSWWEDCAILQCPHHVNDDRIVCVAFSGAWAPLVITEYLLGGATYATRVATASFPGVLLFPLLPGLLAFPLGFALAFSLSVGSSRASIAHDWSSSSSDPALGDLCGTPSSSWSRNPSASSKSESTTVAIGPSWVLIT